MATSDFKKYRILRTSKKSGTETTDSTWVVGTAASDRVLATSFFTHLGKIIEESAPATEKVTLLTIISTILNDSTANSAREKACKSLATAFSTNPSKMAWVDIAWNHVNMEIQNDIAKDTTLRRRTGGLVTTLMTELSLQHYETNRAIY